MTWNGRPLHEAASAVALLDGALRLTVTCWPSTTWRPPSRGLGALGRVIIAVDVPILLAISPHTLRDAANSRLASNPPSRRLGGLDHATAATDVLILMASSLPTAISKLAGTPLQQATTHSQVALQWVHYLERDVGARQVVATTAVTGQGTTAVITGVDAAATAAAVIAAAHMIAPIPRSLPHLSSSAKTCCSSSV